MLKLFRKSSDKAKAKTEAAAALLTPAQLHEFMRRFAIGSKIRYYPEYKEDIILDSVILAYLVNGYLVYSNFDLQGGHDGQALHLKRGNEVITLEPIKQCSVVIPIVSRGEEQLDYQRRDALEQTGGLAIGNTITLLGQQQHGQIAVIETTVAKRTTLKDGHYANQQVAILRIDTGSFILADQRASQRLQTNFPAALELASDPQSHPCTLLDFSEHALRINLDGFDLEQKLILSAKRLTIKLSLPDVSTPYRLGGKVLRRTGDEVVLIINAIERNGSYATLHAMDILEIKSKLLQLPK